MFSLWYESKFQKITESNLHHFPPEFTLSCVHCQWLGFSPWFSGVNCLIIQLVSFFHCEHLSVSSVLCVCGACKHHLFISKPSQTEKRNPVHSIHGLLLSSCHISLTLECQPALRSFYSHPGILCRLYQTLLPNICLVLYFLPFSAAFCMSGEVSAPCCAGTRWARSQPMTDTAAPRAALLGCCSGSVQGTGDSGSCVTSMACQWFTEISWSTLFLGTAFLDKCFSNSKRRFDMLGNKPLPSCGF